MSGGDAYYPELRIVVSPPYWPGRSVMLIESRTGRTLAGRVVRAEGHEVLIEVQGSKLPFQQHEQGRWSCPIFG